MVVCIQLRQNLRIDCNRFWNESFLLGYELKCHIAPTMAKFRCIQNIYSWRNMACPMKQRLLVLQGENTVCESSVGEATFG